MSACAAQFAMPRLRECRSGRSTRSRSRQWWISRNSPGTTALPSERSLVLDLHAPLIGWAGRLDRKKRVEDFIEAAALLGRSRAETRFLVIGGPDAFMPEYERELRSRATALRLAG